MREPEVAEERVIAFLIEAEPTTASESRVRLAVLVEVRGGHPAAHLAVDGDDAAFADVEEHGDVDTTPRRREIPNVSH